MIKRFFILSWVFITALVFLYSFTQVDLGLTLTQLSIWQSIQRSFQYIGYFNRPLSTVLFLILLVILFGIYFWTLYLVSTKKISRRTLWLAIFFMGGLLTFSYNALSYDLFNYIFDAKIVTYYHDSPYIRKALDFPSDPMLGFMHWTHRFYPYGPVWLWVTVPLSFIGSGYFLVTLYLFKVLILLSYLGTTYYIEKILEFLKVKNPLFGVAFFAFSPLVIFEVLVSAHNDIVMIFFAMGAVYFLISRNHIFSYVALALSIGIKFATVFLLPIFLCVAALFIFPEIKHIKLLKQPFLNNENRVHAENLAIGMIISMTIAVVFASLRTEIQPWYFLIVIPFVSLLTKTKIIQVVLTWVSFGLLLIYSIFLYQGEWGRNIEEIKVAIVIIAACIGILFYLLSLKLKHFAIKNIFTPDK